MGLNEVFHCHIPKSSVLFAKQREGSLKFRDLSSGAIGRSPLSASAMTKVEMEMEIEIITLSKVLQYPAS